MRGEAAEPRRHRGRTSTRRRRRHLPLGSYGEFLNQEILCARRRHARRRCVATRCDPESAEPGRHARRLGSTPTGRHVGRQGDRPPDERQVRLREPPPEVLPRPQPLRDRHRVGAGSSASSSAFAFAVGILHLVRADLQVRGVFTDAGGHPRRRRRAGRRRQGRAGHGHRRRPRPRQRHRRVRGQQRRRPRPPRPPPRSPWRRCSAPSSSASTARSSGPFLADLPDDERVIPVERTKTPFDVFELTKVGTRSIEATDTEKLNTLITQLADVTEGKQRPDRHAAQRITVVSAAIDERDDQLQQLLDRADKLSATLAEKDETLVGLIDQSQAVLDLVSRRAHRPGRRPRRRRHDRRAAVRRGVGPQDAARHHPRDAAPDARHRRAPPGRPRPLAELGRHRRPRPRRRHRRRGRGRRSTSGRSAPTWSRCSRRCRRCPRSCRCPPRDAPIHRPGADGRRLGRTARVVLRRRREGLPADCLLHPRHLALPGSDVRVLGLPAGEIDSVSIDGTQGEGRDDRARRHPDPRGRAGDDRPAVAHRRALHPAVPGVDRGHGAGAGRAR